MSFFDLFVCLIFVSGGATMLSMIAIADHLQKRRLYKDGVLHTSKGTFVTTNSDGGYTFTPKPKFSKGGLNVW